MQRDFLLQIKFWIFFFFTFSCQLAILSEFSCQFHENDKNSIETEVIGENTADDKKFLSYRKDFILCVCVLCVRGNDKEKSK